MRNHDPRQILIALTAIVMAWSIAGLLTLAFGRPLPSEILAASAGPPASLGDRLPCRSD
jgi:hypothetical protein